MTLNVFFSKSVLLSSLEEGSFIVTRHLGDENEENEPSAKSSRLKHI